MLMFKTRDGGQAGAQFDSTETYRYSLWRLFDGVAACRGTANFLMLNPSTADELKNDPTVERCERRARKGGYAGLVVTNIFALRSTDPRALYAHDDPIGPENDRVILRLAKAAEIVIAAWGVHGQYKQRGPAVMQMLRDNGIAIHTLGVTRQGHPRHPLYVPYEQAPVEYWRPA